MNEQEFIKKEKLLAELEYNLVEDFINIRKSEGITQQDLAENSMVIRQTINRIENLVTSPQISTMLKLLEPMGYTLKIVKIGKEE